jgi:hypothetical protein
LAQLDHAERVLDERCLAGELLLEARLLLALAAVDDQLGIEQRQRQLEVRALHDDLVPDHFRGS